MPGPLLYTLLADLADPTVWKPSSTVLRSHFPQRTVVFFSRPSPIVPGRPLPLCWPALASVRVCPRGIAVHPNKSLHPRPPIPAHFTFLGPQSLTAIRPASGPDGDRHSPQRLPGTPASPQRSSPVRAASTASATVSPRTSPPLSAAPGRASPAVPRAPAARGAGAALLYVYPPGVCRMGRCVQRIARSSCVPLLAPGSGVDSSRTRTRAPNKPCGPRAFPAILQHPFWCPTCTPLARSPSIPSCMSNNTFFVGRPTVSIHPLYLWKKHCAHSVLTNVQSQNPLRINRGENPRLRILSPDWVPPLPVPASHWFRHQRPTVFL
eukprot:EG_transcript_5277